jgi:23S rRNA pseudouridine1911/1915/1917 synthase
MTENNPAGIQDPESRILYISDQYLVVNKLSGESLETPAKKPADLPGNLNSGKGSINLPDLLNPKYGNGGSGVHFFPATPVHRLDVPVSGCCLFARNQDVLAAASGLFVQGGIKKTYGAIVEKNAAAEKLLPSVPVELVHWIIQDTKRNKSLAYDKEGAGRKKGILRYRVLGSGENYVFLEIELITGRHHQIRAQLAELDLHIKGDLKYGARRSEKNGGIRLHARSLRFQEKPGSPVEAIAPPPVMDPLWEAFCAMEKQPG